MNATVTIIILALFVVPALLLCSPLFYDTFRGVKALGHFFASHRPSHAHH